MFGFKWYKPKGALKRSKIDQTLYDLRQINISKFQSVYSSDMSMIRWIVLYPNINTYIDHLLMGVKGLQQGIELNPYQYAHTPTDTYASDFSLGHQREYLDILSTYTHFISQLGTLLTEYSVWQHTDDIVRQYNVRILSKLIDNIYILTQQLIHYPDTTKG